MVNRLKIDGISELIKNEYGEMVALRRRFRQHPEISGQESWTQQTIIEYLKRLGLKPRPIAGTGVLVDIAGKYAGDRVAIRADIDALPVPDECGQPYRSQIDGVSHACGHDGHIAIALGIARVLSGLQGAFAGTVRLLFQPSEEVGPGGALDMIKDGSLDGVAAILGVHLWQPLPAGTAGIHYGTMLAAPGKFAIKILGKGGHGSMPQQTVDPVVAGAQLALALHTIVSRNIDPLEGAVLSVGSIKAGDAFNIIPDTAVLAGTVRCFDQAVLDHIFRRIEELAAGITAAYGAHYELEWTVGTPALQNDPSVVAAVKTAGEKVLGRERVAEVKPVMISDDYSRYLQVVPGAYFFVGCGNPERGFLYPHHHPKFDLDEQALQYGADILLRTALDLAEGKNKQQQGVV